MRELGVHGCEVVDSEFGLVDVEVSPREEAIDVYDVRRDPVASADHNRAVHDPTHERPNSVRMRSSLVPHALDARRADQAHDRRDTSRRRDLGRHVTAVDESDALLALLLIY